MGPLVLIGLGFAVACQAGFFNVGLPGQALAGWFSVVGLPCLPRYATSLDDSSNYRDCPDCWWDCWAIPGILRAYLGTSEVIVTIMMNYIVLYVGNAFIHSFP